VSTNEIKPGDAVEITARATIDYTDEAVDDTSEGRGRRWRVVLEPRNYVTDYRRVWVDADEIRPAVAPEVMALVREAAVAAIEKGLLYKKRDRKHYDAAASSGGVATREHIAKQRAMNEELIAKLEAALEAARGLK